MSICSEATTSSEATNTTGHETKKTLPVVCVRTISREYFLLKSQRINVHQQTIDPDWSSLKKRVSDIIDGELKKRVTLEAQRLGLTCYYRGGKQLVQNFSEIGKAWKHDDSLECARRVNGAINGQFAEDKGYEYRIEETVMEDLGLVYTAETKGKGCIAMMVVRRKSELAKTTMKRSVTTHEAKISTKRTKADVAAEGKRKPKIKESFMICSNDESQWYDKDGAIYSGKIKGDTKKCMSENDYLKTKIQELEASLKENEKVHTPLYLLVLLNAISNTLFTFCNSD